MTAYARFNVFSIVYGVSYMALFLYSELYQSALFRYYPVLGGFYRESQPLETAGPAILWYSWLLGAVVISLVVSLVVPSGAPAVLREHPRGVGVPDLPVAGQGELGQ